MLCYFSTATSRGSPAAGHADLWYALIAPCFVKIVAVAFFPPFSFFFILLQMVGTL
jgi:hypothetical protein